MKDKIKDLREDIALGLEADVSNIVDRLLVIETLYKENAEKNYVIACSEWDRIYIDPDNLVRSEIYRIIGLASGINKPKTD